MAEGFSGSQFASPEDEIRYLRERIAARERELLSRQNEIDPADTETIGKQELKEYASFTPKMILQSDYAIDDHTLHSSVEQMKIAKDPVNEVLDLALEKGIRNALSVLQKMDNAYVVDEVHRRLIEQLRSGVTIQDLREGKEPWQILHMTLYQVTLPEVKSENEKEYQLTELVGMMEQLFSGLRTIGSKDSENHFVIEIAVADKSEDIVFYVAVPNPFTTLFEKHTLSLFPYAQLSIIKNDYNIFVEGGTTLTAELELKRHPIYPLRIDDAFSSDPLAVILNAFSKIEREGGGAAIQFVMRYPQKPYRKKYEEVIKNIQKGMKVKEAISRSTLGGEIMASLGEFMINALSKEDDKEVKSTDPVDSEAVEVFNRKIKTEFIETNIRIAVSASLPHRAEQILTEIESTFNQFTTPEANGFVFNRAKGSRNLLLQKAFAFREFSTKNILPLSVKELSTIIHFPGNGIISSPQFKQSYSTTAAAPTEMPEEGTIIGINKHRNEERIIYSTERDRMRHFYVIGQTGTGKSVLLKNLIIQDIQQGNGVCMIDPHGTDIEDVLGAVPEERIDDLIYFDPSRQDRVLGLNMLEFDPTKPEQKTFVVNELFSIFQKLYGANPESMGPMFEQYFRNSTLLVMEDVESGGTLLDISRVMADANYRNYKLRRAQNPVVKQFWEKIATKAGGEQSLENFVPYITSKIDPLTANDYIRPIIGQQTSSFNFRQIMDERKILLVNLSKGRLGEINANLIGMIIVGKLLMAALSRVDDPSMNFAPFYLHIDEFQNVSTPAIASILSEARKYKLSLTMAHQYIAQLDEKIRDAVFGNVGSVVSFRVGSEDAQFLEQQFAPDFQAKDLMNVPNWNAFVRMLANGTPTKPFSIATMAPYKSNTEQVRALIEYSYQRNGRPREEVEAEISARYVEKPVRPDLLGGIM